MLSGIRLSRVMYFRRKNISIPANSVIEIYRSKDMGLLRTVIAGFDNSNADLLVNIDGEVIRGNIEEFYQAGVKEGSFGYVIYDTTNSIYSIRLKEELEVEKEIIVSVYNPNTAAITLKELIVLGDRRGGGE